MTHYFSFSKKEDHLEVTIRPNLKPILKAGFWLQIIGSFVIPPLYILQYIDKDEWFRTLLYMVPSLILFQYFLVTRTYMKNVFMVETLLMYGDRVEIFRKIFKKKKIKTIPLNQHTKIISGVKDDFAIHPLTGKTFDYYGFAVAQNEINYLIADGSMMLTSENESVRFGKNIPSWDAKEIIEAMEKYSGLNLKVSKKKKA